MERADGQVMGDVGRQDADGFAVLTGDALGVVVVVSGNKGVAGVGFQFQIGDIQAAGNLGRGNLAEVILPLEVVGVEMLRIEIRLLEASLDRKSVV